MQKIRRFLRWGFGLGAATAVLVLAATFLISPKSQAMAAEVMAKGAKAVMNLSSIHMRCRARTLPADNFSQIGAQHELVTIEMWKQYAPEPKWRIDKPGRVALMDGQSTLLFIRPSNTAIKGPPSRAAFDTGWLHEMADLEKTIVHELQLAKVKGWQMEVARETDASGAAKAIVTIEAKSGLADADYLKNKFFSQADTRRVYHFDDQTERLEAVQVFLHDKAGDVLVFQVEEIDCDQPIDPAVFHLELPANIVWQQEPQKLPDNGKYVAMTAEQAARTFFEACAKEDWTEAAKFYSPLDDLIKQHLAGLTVVNVGASFTSAAYPGKFVPYEIRLRDGTVKKLNLALKRHPKAERWFVDGGI